MKIKDPTANEHFFSIMNFSIFLNIQRYLLQHGYALLKQTRTNFKSIKNVEYLSKINVKKYHDFCSANFVEEKQQSNGSNDNRKVVRHCIALERKIRFGINNERLISQKLIYTLF